MIRIGVDVLGGDSEVKGINGVDSRMLGSLRALELVSDLEIAIFGYQKRTNSIITDEQLNKFAGVNESPNSMKELLEVLKEGELKAGVSASNTQKLLPFSSAKLGRYNNGDKKITPALSSFIPKIGGGRTLMLDLGGTLASGVDLEKIKEVYLNNALLGIAYSQANGIESPKIGLLNIGIEPDKGPEYLKEIHNLFKSIFGNNFVGNIENVLDPNGADIIVTDAFTGNVALKTMEATAKGLMIEIKTQVISNLRGKVGGILIKPNLQSVRDKYNPNNYSGANILGIDGLVVKSHGNSDSESFAVAILKTYEQAKAQVHERTRENFLNLLKTLNLNEKNNNSTGHISI